MNILQLQSVITDIARYTAPFDTGNLQNSIFSELKFPNIEIVSRGAIAPYNIYTDARWISPRWGGKRNPNQGWFSLDITANVAKWINAYYNGKFDSETLNYQALAERSKSFPAQNERFLAGLRG